MRILYIDIDTLRADHLGCYGYHRKTSPNIDKIAEEGTIFRQCYASDAPCLPSRASLFTGRFGIHTGIVGHGGTAADLRLTGPKREFSDQQKEQFWISQLRKKGFYTVTVSSYAERHSAYWFYSGWNEMYNPGFRGMDNAEMINKFAEKWLKENGSKDKWFLHLNYWDPHTPYRVPDSFGNPFENDPFPSWLTADILDEHRNSYGPHSAQEIHGFKAKRHYKRVYPRIPLSEIRNLDDFKTWIDGYDTGIRYVDEHVGKIITILQNLDVYEDTLILVSSDHGENQGELNIYGDHMTACHITNRVPMIIKWPKKNWKKEYNVFIYATDVAATILEGLGKEIPSSWDGRSFFNQIENNRPFGRDYLVISQNAWSCQRTVRFDNWTLIRTYHTGLKNFPEIMLFNFEEDFHMTKNLANDKPDIVSECLKLLDEWHEDMMKYSDNKIDPMQTVLRERGPYHTRGYLENYLKRLEKTGRSDLIPIILERDEPY